MYGTHDKSYVLLPILTEVQFRPVVEVNMTPINAKNMTTAISTSNIFSVNPSITITYVDIHHKTLMCLTCVDSTKMSRKHTI